jgi:hypothetical protein
MGVLTQTMTKLRNEIVSAKHARQPILILIGIWGSMAFIGWKAWPHDLETASIDWTTPQAIDTGTQDLALMWRGFPHH